LILLRIIEDQVEKSLDVSTCIELAREAYRLQAEGQVLNPSRAWLSVPEEASLYCMPAHILGSKTLAVKIARVARNKAGSPLPSTLATLYLYDSKTGEPVAEIEAATLTAKRTAASTAVATDELARANSTVLGLFGIGVQAEAHIPAIMQVRKIDKILAYSRNNQKLAEFANNASERYHLSVIAAKSESQVLETSDVLVLATSSPLPLFEGRLVRPGTHVNAIGAALPTTREVDSYLVKHSKLIVDSREQALSSYGDILIPIKESAIEESHILGELGTVLAQHRRFSRSEGDITLFKSGGISALDAVFAEHLIKISKN
jgi:ornithine cyclodeaminase/alanine dehydrogenase-like protein (mu-crystallin family)